LSYGTVYPLTDAFQDQSWYDGIVKHVGTKGKTMAMTPTLALIAIRPGSLQESVVALMTTMRRVNAVLIAEDAAAVLQLVAKHRPALVVIETHLSTTEKQVTLHEIKARWPTTRCIALAEDVRQQQQAESAGADAVLIVGFPAAELIAAIEELLSGQDKGGACID